MTRTSPPLRKDPSPLGTAEREQNKPDNPHRQRRESMSITYGRPAQETVPFPRELAVLIVKKACRMAEKFENECIDTMQRDARRALQRGTDPAVIVRQLGL